MWTDAHCHLAYDAWPPAPGDEATVAETVAEARAAGVDRLVTVGTDVAHSRAAVDIARTAEGVWATAGVHPHDASQGVEGLAELLSEPEVVAVGECGLDYHYDRSPRPVQRDVFAAQIALARALDLALVIHTREAWDDTFAILAAEGVPGRTVFHCFTGGPVEARRALDVGAVLSFSGIVTFKTAGDLRAAAALCPVDRMTVETDSPFLSPVPHRGRANRPAWVPLVGEAVAAAKGIPVEVVEAATTATATALYRLP